MLDFVIDLSSPYVIVCLVGGMLLCIVSAILNGFDNLKLDAKSKVAKALALHPLMKELYTEDALKTSFEYSAKRGFFANMTGAVSYEIENVAFLLGVPAALVWLSMHISSIPFPLQIAVAMTIATIAKSLMSIPFSVLSDKIEKMYGYSNMTFKTLLSDKAKGIVAFSMLFTLEVCAAYYALSWIGKLNVMTVVLFFFALQIASYIMSIIEVYIVMPMFNKFTRLEDGELHDKLKNLVEKYGYKLENVFVMDASRRSKKGNAYCMSIPFGPKRIVIYDTLMQQLTTDEIVAVFAHELGHEKLHHNQLQWAINFASTLAMAICAVMLMYNIDMYHAFGFWYVNDSNVLDFAIIGIWIASMLFSSISWLLEPFMSTISRKCEYAADKYAKENGKCGDVLAIALMKLEQKNGGDLAPSKAYMWWHASHPGIVERVNAILK